MEYIMEGVRARSRKGEQWGELWTVLFWESFTEDGSSPNLVFAMGWNIKQSNKLASAPEGKAGLATEHFCVDPELDPWRLQITCFVTGKGRSHLQKGLPGVWCFPTCPAWKAFPAIPSCSALRVRRSASKHSCFSSVGNLGWSCMSRLLTIVTHLLAWNLALDDIF